MRQTREHDQIGQMFGSTKADLGLWFVFGPIMVMVMVLESGQFNIECVCYQLYARFA